MHEVSTEGSVDAKESMAQRASSENRSSATKSETAQDSLGRLERVVQDVFSLLSSSMLFWRLLS